MNSVDYLFFWGFFYFETVHLYFISFFFTNGNLIGTHYHEEGGLVCSEKFPHNKYIIIQTQGLFAKIDRSIHSTPWFITEDS